MPTQRPRIQIMLPEDLHQSIATISRLSNLTMAGFLSQILKAEAETIHQIANMMMQAKEAQDKLSISGRVQIEKIALRVDDSKHQVRESLDQMHVIIHDAVSSQDAAGDARSVPRAGPENPLAINKGVKKGVEKGVDSQNRSGSRLRRKNA